MDSFFCSLGKFKNMDKIDLIEEGIQNIRNDKELERLERKLRKRTEYELLIPVAKTVLVFSYLIQLFSWSMAFGGVLWFVKWTNIPPAFSVPFLMCVLIVFELGKRQSFESFNIQRISRSKFSPATIVFMIFFSAFSIITSGLGSSTSVKEVVNGPVLIDTAQIASVYQEKIEENRKFWTSQQNDALAKAEEIHRRNSWKERTSRDARPAVLKQEMKASSMNDSLIVYRTALVNAMNKEIWSAVDKNEIALKDFDSWTSSFTWFVVLAVVLSEATFFLLMWFLGFFEELKKDSLTVARQIQEPVQEVKTSTKKASVQDDEEKHQEKHQDIGFAYAKKKNNVQEGDIVKEGTKDARIYIKNKKTGQLQPKTEGNVRNVFNNSSESRKAELKPFLEKIEKFNLKK